MISLVLIALLAQAPAPTPTPPAPADGLIAGRVVDGLTGKPVTGVVVTLTMRTPAGTPAPAGAAAQLPPRVLVDPTGRFIFTKLTPGSYDISAARRGYFNGSFGKLRVEGSGLPLNLAASEKRTDVTIRIWKSASIAGALLDEMNEPLVGVRVSLLRREWVAGEIRFVAASSDQTDDRGRYRIGALYPGDYLISVPATQTTIATSAIDDYYSSAPTVPQLQTAVGLVVGVPQPPGSRFNQRVGDVMLQTSPSAITQPQPSADGKFAVYPTTFYPASPEPNATSSAAVVTIGAGESKIVPPMHLRPVTAVRVSGIVTRPDGPAAFTPVVLIPQYAEALSSEVGFESARTMTDAAGAFTLVGVPPGSYRVRAFTSTAFAVGPTKGDSTMPQPPAPPTYWLNDTLTIGARDVVVTLAMKPALTLGGRVVFEGQKAQPPAAQLAREVLTYTSADGRQTNRLASRYVGAADGSFNFFDVPGGRTILIPYQPPPGWYLRSLAVNGQDAIDAPIDVTDDMSGIVATFTDRPASLKGVVRLGSAVSDAEAVVLIFPSNQQRWVASGRSPLRFRTVRPDAAGVFSVTGMVPGDYFVAAVSEASLTNWQSPKVLETISRQASRITLTEGATIVQDLKRLDVK